MIEILPDAIRKGGNAVLANIDEWIGKLIQKISTPTVAAAGNVAKKIPSLLIGINCGDHVRIFFYCTER